MPHTHQRDGEPPSEHRRKEEWIPEAVRWIPTFINRTGFPIFAFIILSYFYFIQNANMIRVMGDLKDVMARMTAELAEMKADRR